MEVARGVWLGSAKSQYSGNQTHCKEQEAWGDVHWEGLRMSRFSGPRSRSDWTRSIRKKGLMSLDLRVWGDDGTTQILDPSLQMFSPSSPW